MLSAISANRFSLGSFWVDPATYDIVRISMEAEEIPPNLPVLASVTSIDYARTNLGGTDFLLPQSADSRLLKFPGAWTCRPASA